jgi:CPA2 family monovalent cation:H+ antiporter-2
VGPYTPGFVADAQLASRLAEIGVILLMFSVGMHFDLADLLRVRRVAVPGAIAQSAVAGVAGWAVARAFGWSDIAGAVFGMSLAVASTAVLTRMLIDHGLLATRGGHVAVGWLIVEDLFTVLALVALPALATTGQGAAVGSAVALATAKAAAFAVLLWILGHRLVARVIERVARTRSEELFTLAVFVIALGTAAVAAGVFHVSVALGAFFAGLVVARTRLGPQAAAYMAPFRDVFSALFFVSVGMLFNPMFLIDHPIKVVAATAIVLIAKPLAALVIVRLLRDPPGTAQTVAVGLAQIGEFSFLLGTLAVGLGVLPQEALDTTIAAALISIAVNPLLFRWLARREALRALTPAVERARRANASGSSAEATGNHVVLCGEGPLRAALLRRLRDEARATIVIDDDLDVVDALEKDGVQAVFGDATRADVLRAAGIERAGALAVVGAPLARKMAICLAARNLAPEVGIVVATADAAERAWLQEFGASAPCDTTAPAIEELGRALRRALAGR